jgi:hypothetical protein
VPPDHRQAVDDLLESVEAFDLSRLRDILACGRAAPVILEPRALVAALLLAASEATREWDRATAELLRREARELAPLAEPTGEDCPHCAALRDRSPALMQYLEDSTHA